MMTEISSTSLPPDGNHAQAYTVVGVDKVILILVGLIGAGKSTFAQALEQYYPNFRRCNQDELGDRRRVERLARDSLREGLSVCIDRTNFNESQRAYWINIAHEFPGTRVWVIVFDTPYEECATRLRQRAYHPTITSPEQGLSLLARFASDYRPPSPYEGYDRIISLKASDHLSDVYTRAEITVILQRVRDSPPVVTPATGMDHNFSRGRGNRRPYGTKGTYHGYPTRFSGNRV